MAPCHFFQDFTNHFTAILFYILIILFKKHGAITKFESLLDILNYNNYNG